MSTSTAPAPPHDVIASDAQHQDAAVSQAIIKEMKVTPFDRVASMVSSLLILVGCLALLLFLVWLTNQVWVRQVTLPVEPIEFGDGMPKGIAEDMEPPGLEEIDEEVEPDLAESMEVLTDAVSSVAAALDTREAGSEISGHGEGLGHMDGDGGQGGPRGPKPWERWEINFTTTSIDAYARQLDYFKIELGAIGGGYPHVDYARNLSNSTATTRKGGGDGEKRVYFSYAGRQTILRRWDRQLLEQRGKIPIKGRIALQFYPPEVISILLQLEREKAGQRGTKNISKTVFGIQSSGGKHTFYVEDQQFVGGRA